MVAVLEATVSARDFTAIASARVQLSDAFAAIDAAEATLADGGLSELAQDLRNTAGGLRHFAGPEGVMAWVEKGEADG